MRTIGLNVRCSLLNPSLVGVEDIVAEGFDLEDCIEDFKEQYKKLEAQYDCVLIDEIYCEDEDGNEIEVTKKDLEE